ncbi:hypothetical protein OESDEN_02841, partial [Oesophagostomum dentatum]
IEEEFWKHPQILAQQKAALDAKIEEFAGQITIRQNGTGKHTNARAAEKFMKDSYVELLKQESLFSGSTYQKLAESKYKWTFGSAVFFSMNVYTTTGYGNF